MQEGATFQRSPAFADCPVERSAVILNAEQQLYFAVNRVGARIWRLLERPCTVAEIVQVLTSEFAVEPGLCRHETVAFLRQLIEQQLAVQHD